MLQNVDLWMLLNVSKVVAHNAVSHIPFWNCIKVKVSLGNPFGSKAFSL